MNLTTNKCLGSSFIAVHLMLIDPNRLLPVIEIIKKHYRRTFIEDHTYMEMLDAETILRTRPVTINAAANGELLCKTQAVYKAWHRVLISSDTIIPIKDKEQVHKLLSGLRVKLILSSDKFRLN